MKKFLFPALMAVLSACVQSVDIKGPAYQKKPVLVGTLHPDSLLTVRLSWSKPTSGTATAVPITDARVIFSQDRIALGQANHLTNGSYQLSIKPTENHLYAVSVTLSSGQTLFAEDYLPLWPAGQVIVSDKKKDNVNANPDITIQLDRALADSSFLWMGLYVTQYSSYGYPDGCIVNGQIKEGCVKDIRKLLKSNYITTRSAVLDPFNGFFDALINKNSNSSPARVRPDVFNANPGYVITVAPLNQGEPWIPEPTNQVPPGENILELFTVGPAYDRYLKSAITGFQNRPTDFEGDLFNPFAEPTPVYSNVKNGLGLFGARNGRYIVLKLNTSNELK
ncbi:DUF4249 family protein [Larkinella rosea]|uniref:DUF4249 family protein n=1 Tax=Larkinella rosea TaxID=2025312 RepID=A0A3P1BHZ6_9BACT|nr:DUF4249 family protein [Larkinella rosea]RRB00671.1 DUF4249 family protein [Larkinella rosea]